MPMASWIMNKKYECFKSEYVRKKRLWKINIKLLIMGTSSKAALVLNLLDVLAQKYKNMERYDLPLVTRMPSIH